MTGQQATKEQTSLPVLLPARTVFADVLAAHDHVVAFGRRLEPDLDGLRLAVVDAQRPQEEQVSDLERAGLTELGERCPGQLEIAGPRDQARSRPSCGAR